jgi:hypothetical protein
MQMVKRGIPNGLPTRLVYRSIYVVLTTFVAISIPFFGSLMVSILVHNAPIRSNFYYCCY